MTQKTLLVLGGSRLIVPVIEAAHALGHRIVTCDYLPDNYAHRFADEYRDVSIVDREAVLATAQEVGADGVISFAADPGVVSAAYAVEQMGLPEQVSFAAATTLQTKHVFREFLTHHGFPSPRAWSVESVEAVVPLLDEIVFPVIVKPADAAGSKGVTRVDERSLLRDAISTALTFSLTSRCIIETFIETSEPQRSAEGFTIDGEFVALHFMDQLFDTDGPNPYAPVGNILPDTMSDNARRQVTDDLQRLARLLDFGSGIFNIEVRVATDGTPYIVEVSPRGGGNRLAEFIHAATGQDLIRATVQAALGEPIDGLPRASPGGVWLQEMLVSRKTGEFQRVRVDKSHEESSLHSLALWVAPGDWIEQFSHATFALGSSFSQFESRAELSKYLRGNRRAKVEVLVPRDLTSESHMQC